MPEFRRQLDDSILTPLAEGHSGSWIFTAWMILISATTPSVAPIILWFIGLFVVILLWLVSRFNPNVRKVAEDIHHAAHS